MKFRKKTVAIEAFQFTDNCEPPDWIKEHKGFTMLKLLRDDNDTPFCISATIETPEGKMPIIKGDWIIKDTKGEFYLCRPDDFEATYEPETNEATP